MIALGVLMIRNFPKRKENHWSWNAVAALCAVMAICGCVVLPEAVFLHDKEVRYAGSDYGRAQSAEAAYDNMFNCHRLYQVCGVFQTAVKDVYTNFIYPITPGYASAQAAARQEIDGYFAQRGAHQDNEMTGIFEGKNVIFVLMESMDDWAIGEHTPTICRLMDEGINFTNFYTPGYGGVRTFNSEFCANTGSFLSSQGGYAFDYVTNNFDQSLANQLKKLGYTAKTYHYNDPNFYSRGVFEPAMGYDEYVCYADYSDPEDKWALYDEEFLFNHEEIARDFLRDGPKLNYIITRSAHLSYKYNEMLSYYALKRYPAYRGLTGSEEEDCMYVKAKIVDDLFARLLQELEADGELESTVIVAFTDHYTYGMDDQQLVMDRSHVQDPLLVEKTPFFIWTPGGPDLEVTKTLNTSDLLPTVLNLMGVETDFNYLGQDAFDENYVGYALFPNGSWVSQGIAYNVSGNALTFLSEDAPAATMEFQKQMSDTVMDFIRINNLILETDYYEQ
jgi:phosphoglycerol transferase MdoB-like AlkP superfamily enzyme